MLYVDEVNLLDDHVVDLLLDSAAMGVNVVEREGISFSHPARFMLVGTMNPEEGDLRPQLLDRFALCVDMHGISDPRQRVAIVERRIAYESDPEGFYQEWLPHEEQLSDEIAQARNGCPGVRHTQRDLYTIAQLTTSFRVDGHRADIVILKTARAHAAWQGRLGIAEQDILLAAELALPHRLKRQPFEEASMDAGQLEDRLKKARVRGPAGPAEHLAVRRGRDGAQRKKSTEPLEEQATASASGDPAEDARASAVLQQGPIGPAQRQDRRQLPGQAARHAPGQAHALVGRQALVHPDRPQARPLHQVAAHARPARRSRV